jgi:hypothetical protein
MNPQELANMWASQGKASVQKWAKKIQAVTVSPTQMAADKADLWQTKVSSVEAKEKFQRKLRAIGPDEWKRITLAKGQKNMVVGFDEGKAKYEKVAGAILQAGAQSKAAAKAVDKGSDTDGIERVRAAIMATKAFWGGRA